MGDFVFLSGVVPRQPITNDIPGGPIKDENGNPLNYDIRAQTEACILNIEAILKSSGAGLADIIDVTSFLIDMDRDFEG